MSGPDLSDVIGKLRSSLAKAQEEGDKKDLRFTIEDIEIELQVGITKEGDGEAGVKFWVVEAKAGAKLSDTVTQKIKLRMKLADKFEETADGEKLPRREEIADIDGKPPGGKADKKKDG